MYGAQARIGRTIVLYEFENDVEMYGAQAKLNDISERIKFENDVEMYGAQASSQYHESES